MDFSTAPGWSGLNNNANGNNYGWNPLTDQADRISGSVGGTFARAKIGSYYGDTNLSQTSTLGNQIVASGKFNIRNMTLGWCENGASRFFIGHFSENIASQEFIGLEFENNDVNTMLVHARMQKRIQKPGEGGADGDWATVSINENHTFSYSYDPNLGTNGRLTMLIDSQPPLTVDLSGSDRSSGASFDAFGIGCGSNRNSEDAPTETAEVYIDDVNYSGLQTISTPIGNELAGLPRLRIETSHGSIGPVGSRSSECQPGKFPRMSDRLIGYAAGTFEYTPIREQRTTEEGKSR